MNKKTSSYNLVVFFGTIAIFAGPSGPEWVEWYFGSQAGLYFLAITVFMAIALFPLFRKLRLGWRAR